MDLTEFRVGNWLQISYMNAYDICRVEECIQNGCVVRTLNGDIVAFDTLDKLRQLMGIPINEENLRRLGFICDSDTYRFFGVEDGINGDVTAQSNGDTWIITKSDDNVQEIRFLHTLQNFLADNTIINFDTLFGQ